ncbi:MAG: hypothetical protein NC211_02225 [Alistipes senegalensis]|nr:hypothetical protein [Oxalobacter formigenes]MCM1280642.1 hypothetical protein [Alistipes senegalensis]
MWRADVSAVKRIGQSRNLYGIERYRTGIVRTGQDFAQRRDQMRGGFSGVLCGIDYNEKIFVGSCRMMGRYRMGVYCWCAAVFAFFGCR